MGIVFVIPVLIIITLIVYQKNFKKNNNEGPVSRQPNF